jgi:hydroxypyruvate reductase
MMAFQREHDLIERLFRAGIAAVEPRSATSRALQEIDIPRTGRLIVVAVGKAASAMARGAVDVVGDRIASGVVLTKDGHLESQLEGFDAFEARHPLPDERGIDATRHILDLVSNLAPHDTVVALVSGGGSALLEAPVDPLTLRDLERLTDALLRAGAPIQDLNAVRSAVSRVKRGGLRRAIGPARCVSLILSDVLGNDPAVIASGPTVATAPDRRLALEVLSRYDVANLIPPAINEVLDKEAFIAPHVDGRDVWRVIADNQAFLEAVERAARRDGLHPSIVWTGVEGEARELGAAFARLPFPEGVDLMIGGGEATVTVRGHGVGGRNTEFALAAAVDLSDRIVASLASDGDDGSSRAAGAIVDPETIFGGAARGLDVNAALDNNDSATYVADIGGLVRSGPTGTNVNDLYLALRLDR